VVDDALCCIKAKSLKSFDFHLEKTKTPAPELLQSSRGASPDHVEVVVGNED
jgi:hypothetical protein